MAGDACSQAVSISKLYPPNSGDHNRSKATTLLSIGSAGFITAARVADAMKTAVDSSNIPLALELKIILDDVLLQVGTLLSSGTNHIGQPKAPGGNTATGVSQAAILSVANPDAFHLTHLSTGNGLWIPGTCISFTEKYSPIYTKEMVYGRMDPITTYGSTSRTVTFNWEVDTNGGADIYALAAINDVVKFMYPLYEGTAEKPSSLKGAPTLRAKFLNLLGNTVNDSVGLIVVVDSFDISGVDGSSQGLNAIRRGGMLVPQSYELSFTFTVLHEKKVVGFTKKNEFGQGGSFPYNYATTIGSTPSGPASQATKLDVRKLDQPSLMQLNAVKRKILI